MGETIAITNFDFNKCLLCEQDFADIINGVIISTAEGYRDQPFNYTDSIVSNLTNLCERYRIQAYEPGVITCKSGLKVFGLIKK